MKFWQYKSSDIVKPDVSVEEKTFKGRERLKGTFAASVLHNDR